MDTLTAQKQIVGLITDHLSESIPVTRILNYKPDKSGSVTGKFESLNRVFNFVFDGVNVKYKPAMNVDSALFSEYYLKRFDAAPATVKGARALPKCTSKSYSCKGNVGVRCLPLNQSCKLANTAIGNERLSKIKKMSQMLADKGHFSSRLEGAKDELIKKRMALAVENRAKKIKSANTKSAPDANVKPNQKVEKNLTKVEAKNESNQTPQSDQRLVAKDIPIKQFNKDLDAWNKYTDKLPKKERASIPNIEDNYGIIRGIRTQYGAYKAVKSEYVKDDNHIAITDPKGLLQAALHYRHSKEDGFKIEYLATAPWNLQKDSPNKQKGSGARAIAEAIKKSKELGYGGKITLHALPNAVPFYRHLGFKDTDKGFVLTPKAANELLKKYGA